MHLRNQTVEVNDLGGDDLFAGECEELCDKAGGAQRGLPHMSQVSVCWIRVWELLFSEFGVAQNGSEQVVKVVGDASGESADALHLLGLEKRLFRSFALDDLSQQGGIDRDNLLLRLIHRFSADRRIVEEETDLCGSRFDGCMYYPSLSDIDDFLAVPVGLLLLERYPGT